MNNDATTTASQLSLRASSISSGSSPRSLQSRRPSYRPVQSQQGLPPLPFDLDAIDKDRSRTPPKSKRRGSMTSEIAASKNLYYYVVITLVSLTITWFFFFRSSSTRVPVRIPSQTYEYQSYQHLDFSQPINIEAGTRVFHVTKEFGPATMGGLAVMLTALALAQAESPDISISVILPHYSFLRKSYPKTKLVVDLSIPVIQRGKSAEIKCKVQLLKWKYSTMIDFLNPNLEIDVTKDSRTMDIYLVGPGDTSPFNVAFKASDAGDIYSAYKPLKQEWKDLWFAKSSAALINFLNSEDGKHLDVHEDVKKSLGHKKALIDVVHLHGATNAMVAFFLRQAELATTSHALPPAIIYSLHDSLDEVEYSNLVRNVAIFLDSSPSESSSATSSQLPLLKPYIYGEQLFTSALGVDLGNMVTFVSRSIAQNIVEGRFKFSLHDLIMPSISARASNGSFIGVTNGLDFTELSKNPFMSPVLIKHLLSFPRIGKDLLKPDTFWTTEPLVSTLINPSDSKLSAISFVHAKERAKQHLISSLPSLFNPSDLNRPFFLFVGRYQYNKGCQFFAPLLQLISSTTSTTSPYYNARLILLGAPNNFPITLLQNLARQYPNHLTLISSSDFQTQWGTIIRMASDFSFVPSFSEAFGLVAVEGLAFGMRVVSTGVGGLGEFLVPVDGNSNEEAGKAVVGNSHLFSLQSANLTSSSPSNSTNATVIDYSISAEYSRPSDEVLRPAFEACLESVKEAITGWHKLRAGEWIDREKVVRGLVGNALSLGWNRDKGPVEEYNRIYTLAIGSQLHALLVDVPAPRVLSPVAIAEKAHPVPHLPSEIKARTGFHPADDKEKEIFVAAEGKRGRKKKRVS